MTVDGRQRSTKALANAKRAIIMDAHSADADGGRRGGQKLPIALRIGCLHRNSDHWQQYAICAVQ